jgi:inositol polyphosphate 5-phosphatase INPP5B/F
LNGKRYAVGFQELDLTAEALLLGDTTRAAPWEQQIMTTLSLQGEYVRVCLYLLLFYKSY